MVDSFTPEIYILCALLLCFMSRPFCAQYDFSQPFLTKAYISPNQIDIADNKTYTTFITKLSFESGPKIIWPIKLPKKSLQPLQKNKQYKSLLLKQGSYILKTTGATTLTSGLIIKE